jgi:hypothetical protein
MIKERDEKIASYVSQIQGILYLTIELEPNENIPVLEAEHSKKMEELSTQAEQRVKFERERAKRLAYKIEELKERNKKLKSMLQSGKEDGAARDEIESLNNEIIALQEANSDMIRIFTGAMEKMHGAEYAHQMMDAEFNPQVYSTLI